MDSSRVFPHIITRIFRRIRLHAHEKIAQRYYFFFTYANIFRTFLLFFQKRSILRHYTLSVIRNFCRKQNSPRRTNLIAPIAIGTALSSSLGFMMPVSTPPNAIVYASGYVPITKMIKSGIIIDIIGILVITIPVVMLLVKFVMGV